MNEYAAQLAIGYGALVLLAVALICLIGASLMLKRSRKILDQARTINLEASRLLNDSLREGGPGSSRLK